MSVEFVIPRAMSVDPTDPRYRVEAINFGPLLTIWLDGVEQRNVTTYDQDEGSIIRHVTDARGRPQLNPNAPGELWTETIHGAVEVTLKEATCSGSERAD